MTSAIAGPGFLLSMGDGATPENFTTVAEVGASSFSGMTTDMVEATNQSSPDGYVEKVPTIHRPGEFDFDCNFLPSDGTHNAVTGLVAKKNARTKVNFRAGNGSDPKVWTFAAYVVSIAPKFPVAGLLTSSIKLQITGKPVLA
jgi:hypothetical protein